MIFLLLVVVGGGGVFFFVFYFPPLALSLIFNHVMRSSSRLEARQAGRLAQRWRLCIMCHCVMDDVG